MNTTPIVSGLYPDPSICRADGHYYLVNSSFEYLPGLPLHRSTDLVSWTPIGHALTRPSQIPDGDGAPSSGIFAPTIRHHDGRFWIITTNLADLMQGKGLMVLSASDPEGQWSDPTFLPGVMGIDPDLVWDDDGTARVTWSGVHPAGIHSAPVDLEQGTLLAEPRLLWQGTGGAHPEGPHLYRIDGWWYLLLAEGGTERGHMSTVARARTLDDTFEPAPGNPILSHRSTTHPVQNTGHADLLQLSDGSWALVHLGVRPRGRTPGFHVNGRETFLAGVDWIDGWPVVDEDRYDIPIVDHSFEDHFDTAKLDPRWLGAGSFPSSFTQPDPAGGLRLDRDAVTAGKGLLATRVRDEAWTAEARLDVHPGGAVRFSVRIDDDHWYGLDSDGTRVTGTLSIGPAVSIVGETDARDVVALRISATVPEPVPYVGADQPDLLELAAVREDGSIVSFGRFDGRYLASEVTGGFTGRVLAVQALAGSTLLRSFRYTSDGVENS